MISDEVILSEAIRLVQDGVCVTFPVNGRSMLPFIVGGRDSVILEKPRELKVGDIVLAKADTGHFVIHRIESMDEKSLTLMGDGNLAGREHCSRSDVFAQVTWVVLPGGKRRSLGALRFRLAAKIWYILLPLRRYLLWIYRKVN
jgi:hypothetical protein